MSSASYNRNSRSCSHVGAPGQPAAPPKPRATFFGGSTTTALALVVTATNRCDPICDLSEYLRRSGPIRHSNHLSYVRGGPDRCSRRRHLVGGPEKVDRSATVNGSVAIRDAVRRL